DQKGGAQRGGFSGKSVLQGPPEMNELYQRITSTDRTVWMPKGSERLSDDEISLIRRWIDAGCPWPDPVTKPTTSQRTSWFRRYAFLFDWTWWVYWISDPGQLPYAFLSFFARHAGVLCGVLLLLLVQLRLAAAFRAGKPYATGRWRLLCAGCARIRLRPAHFLVALLSLILYVVSARYYEQRAIAIRAANQRARPAIAEIGPYGWPPRPIRPNHPKRLSGTYYRGNCERNPELFNGGHYLTAWLRVELCDGERKPVQVGDPLPASGLTVRFEIERAPNTADALISDAVIQSVFVTSYVRPSDMLGESQTTSQPLPEDSQVLKLETLETNQRWACWYPLTIDLAHPDKAEGLVYVYRGDPAKSAEIHYGISYDIPISHGRIANDSEVWLGSLYLTPVLATPQPGKVPLDEWFDYRPIPPITGENAQDPKLLGIPQSAK
ncbi:MAG TPA: hypothetical protein VHB77_23495, partial [Planctomycetaceae bacterium]|nr:hypothetical protein [Planctomycetaceae bacterium]